MRKLAINLLVLLGALVAVFLVAEIVLRYLGYEPYKIQTIDLSEPVMNEPDPNLGWRSKPGRYSVPPYGPGGRETTVTIWPGGMRASAPERAENKKRILVLGGSFTLGQGVSDEETFVYKLQERFPSVEFLNYGTAGYGTYQCLLLLEEYLRREEPPFMVLYDWIQHHEDRNYGQWWWHKTLKSYSRRNHVAIPYVKDTGKGWLTRMPPEVYPDWFLDRYSALVNFVKDRFYAQKSALSITDRRILTLSLIKKMDDLCAAHGTKFMLVLLNSNEGAREIYRRIVPGFPVDYEDCIDIESSFLDPKNTVPGDPEHPAGRVHTVWSDCIGNAIRDEIAALDREAPDKEIFEGERNG